MFYNVIMNWIFWKKAQVKNGIDSKIEFIVDGKKFVKLPKDIRQLDASYSDLIRELAKR